MRPEGFKTRIERPNKLWLASFLGMVPSTGSGGIDLLSEEIGIELKCRYLKYIQHNYACCEKEYQNFPNCYPQRELYWAFLLYGLNKEPREIEKSRVNLERYITERVVKFVPWDFVQPFPVSYPERSGPFRYVGQKHLPPEESFHLFEQGKTKLYVPKDSSLEEMIKERSERVVVRHQGNVKTVTFY